MEDPATSYLRIMFLVLEDFTCFEPQTLQYKKLKGGQIVSLTLRIMDQNGNLITNGPGTTVVIHVCDCKM